MNNIPATRSVVRALVFFAVSSSTLAVASGCAAASAEAIRQETSDASRATSAAAEPASPLAAKVRAATERFRSVEVAETSGYAMFHGCVTGPGGAMGIYWVNGDLVGDGALDAARPEALMYEQQNGRLRLIGVEYVVLAEAWNAANPAPPVLDGQLFTYTGAPNRYGIPAFYSLHVWAWQGNPDGVFADWNRKVSCAGFDGAGDSHAGH